MDFDEINEFEKNVINNREKFETNKDIKNKFINIPKKIKRKVIKKLITKKILQKMKVFYYHIKNIEMKMMKMK